MRKSCFLFALCFAVFASYAQDSVVDGAKANRVEEQIGKSPVTFNVSLHTGMSTVANHYMSANEYEGLVYGVHVDFGRFYKRGKNVSWNLSFDRNSSVNSVEGLENKAKTSFMGYSDMSLKYASFYNWMFGKGLMVKVGGGLDLSGDMMANLTHKTNNAVSVNALAQLEASAGISYTFEFEKWMLGLSGNISTPFAGLVMTDAKHESGVGSMSKDHLVDSYFPHVKGTSLSNLQGFDLDLGVKFIAKRVAINVDFVSENRYWYVNEIQNNRSNALLRVGATFNLVSLKQTKTVHRYF